MIDADENYPTLEWIEWRSMDDLPDVEHTFAYCADLAEILCP